MITIFLLKDIRYLISVNTAQYNDYVVNVLIEEENGHIACDYSCYWVGIDVTYLAPNGAKLNTCLYNDYWNLYYVAQCSYDTFNSNAIIPFIIFYQDSTCHTPVDYLNSNLTYGNNQCFCRFSPPCSVKFCCIELLCKIGRNSFRS